jgi:hypothetical protein
MCLRNLRTINLKIFLITRCFAVEWLGASITLAGRGCRDGSGFKNHLDQMPQQMISIPGREEKNTKIRSVLWFLWIVSRRRYLKRFYWRSNCRRISFVNESLLSHYLHSNDSLDTKHRHLALKVLLPSLRTSKGEKLRHHNNSLRHR